MVDIRNAMYDACRQVGLHIVPKDTAARIMAFIYLQGGDERVTYSSRMVCEINHIQGSEIPDRDFVLLIQRYERELKGYTDTHNGEWPDWLDKLIEERYNFKPYKL